MELELSGDNTFPLNSYAIIRGENTNRLELQYRVIYIPAEKVKQYYFSNNN